jgi:hypothetical protein
MGWETDYELSADMDLKKVAIILLNFTCTVLKFYEATNQDRRRPPPPLSPTLAVVKKKNSH